jgi:hypothetical protein
MQELEYAILELENKKVEQQKEMAAEFRNTIESLKPMNLIKSSFHKINTNHLAKTVLKTAGGIGVAFLTRKFTGGTLKPKSAKSVVSGLLTSSLGAAVLGNTDKIKAYGTAILKT